jgi:hypothetical protein
MKLIRIALLQAVCVISESFPLLDKVKLPFGFRRVKPSQFQGALLPRSESSFFLNFGAKDSTMSSVQTDVQNLPVSGKTSFLQPSIGAVYGLGFGVSRIN